MKKNIGVFFGGKSPEHDVSIITGQLVISELKKLNYNVFPVYLNKKGKWFIGKDLGFLKTFTSQDVESINRNNNYILDFDLSNNKLVFRKNKLFSKKISIDIAFPAFHGINGEDGTIQGFFELFNVPYVGCDVPSSAISMDKVLTKELYRANNFPTTNFVGINKFIWKKNETEVINKINDKLKYPIFVKPAKLGSSIGMTRVDKLENLKNAIEIAFYYDNKIIIEEAVENLMDITCAVLGNDEPVPSLIQEAIFKNDHFTYEDKYLNDGGAQLGNAENCIVIPARLNSEMTKKVQKMAVDIFKTAGCSGIARIDFLYDKVKNIFFANEINALPGTLYHHLWKKSGIEIGELIEKLISLAIEKQKEKESITSTFNSDILNFANSIKLNINKN